MDDEQDRQVSVVTRRDDLPGQHTLPAVQAEAVANVLGDLGGPTLHNFEGDATEVWKQVARVSAAPCLSYDDVIGTTVLLKHFFVHRINIAGDTPGEFTEAIRTVLVPPTGQPVAFVSESVARDLGTLIRTFGLGPWPDPIQVQIVAVKTRKGFKTLRMIPAE
jgi:hypothetical protein